MGDGQAPNFSFGAGIKFTFALKARYRTWRRGGTILGSRVGCPPPALINAVKSLEPQAKAALAGVIVMWCGLGALSKLKT